ncbi:glycerophosphodiester phosphodiesterase GDPDL7 [Sesamum indicum]|uniref:glycerophosphodiester phosphodiesterase n=1 Tax=Sesamum indicum TaxID=4182 RepID=A0A6I9TGC5_SESIN|nr:glycerophosphodiester phosphodiesterase GDPDL7 [Sesamum indicum]
MIGYLLLSICLFQTIEARHGVGKPPPQRKWMTLHGGQPEVIASGGYSGFYPDSCLAAYDLATESSIPGTILYCNLQFSKDSDGFCISSINLQNTTNIDGLDPKGTKTYNINGQDVTGWFGLDYTIDFILRNVTLKQNIFTRQGFFDGAPIVKPLQITEDKFKKPTRLWLNIEYDMFYKKHKINPEAYLLEKFHPLPEFISSPEIGFLRSIKPKIGNAKTNLIFTILAEPAVEPTTKQTYGSLVKDLAMIKSFASGILIPKEYIWPVNNARVLQPSTSLVQDAHREGLSVYASGFANDNFLSYNYSFDPAREYLQFFDNSQFAVDGVLSDFPSTASEAIGCLNPNKNASRTMPTLIISHNGASGDYPGSSDLAYQKAIDDGADIIDCSVQLSKDGMAFCSDRADILKTTTAATMFMDRITKVPEIQERDGIFSFDLTWSEIQSLKPQIESTFENELARNPAHKNSGKFVTLSEFLELAKQKAVAGIYIKIKNAAYLASQKNLDIVGTVSSALSNATLDKEPKQKVHIQSDDSSVLLKFKDNPSYQRVFYIYQPISGAPAQVAQEVKKYADAVFVHRDAVVMSIDNFCQNFTNTIPAFHAVNISVYVGILKDEFENLIFDYLSDPYVELATFNALKVDGFVTDYPATANMFVRSSCATQGSPYVIKPVEPGYLYVAPPPITEPPLLSTADVVDPPLPAIAKNMPTQSAAGSAPTSGPPSAPPPPAAKSSSTSSVTVGAEGFILAAIVALLTVFT